MYYGFLPYPRTHMPAAEASAQLASYELRGLDAYELRGLGTSPTLPPPSSTPPSTGSGSGVETAVGVAALAALTANFFAPIFVGYGVYKRGHGLGLSAAAWLASGFVAAPLIWMIPLGSILVPAAAAYYAFKD